jgi:N-acetylmuramoyl-L-alanine amidase
VFALIAVGLYYSFGVRTRSLPAGAIDTPAEGAVIDTSTVVSGWAIDQAALGNAGVDRVQLYVDGAYLGDANYGLGRTDIGGSFGLQFGASGWSTTIDPNSLSGGQHQLEVRARSLLGGQEASYIRQIVVALGTAPNGAFDAPDEGATIASLTDLRGWAIDQRASAGTGVDRVQLYVDGTPLGDVQYGQNRADVAVHFGPQFGDSGWSMLLDAHALSVGQHTLEVRARSTLTGRETSYSRPVVTLPATAPRGAIDPPGEGAVVAGTIDVNGWAIDESASEGTGVDRVRVYLDDELVGEATYGAERTEIGGAYGAHFRSSGWAAQVDFSARPGGLHVLEARVRSVLTGAETTYTRTVNVE